MENYELKKNDKLKNRYQIISTIGHGGFGTVYKAMDSLVGRYVAIKASKNSLSKEAKILKELKNVPHISHMYEYFKDGNQEYIVMRHITGITLSEYYKNHNMKLSIKELRPMLISICMTLSQMHKHGIIHRDISPGNIMITDDNDVYLIDFGTATSIVDKSLRNVFSFSHKGLDAPERINEDLLGPGTDIYSLCATVIYLISGEGMPLYSERLKYDIMPSLLLKLPINAKQQNALLKGISIDISKRYKDAMVFLRDFEGDNDILNSSDTKYIVEYVARTDTGKRTINQDNFMIDSYFSYSLDDCQIDGHFPSSASHIHIVALADGVSSSCYGELASRAAMQAVSHFIDNFKYDETLPERLLEDLLDQINEKIITLGNKIGKTASTISVLMWKNNRFYAANIGDSPIYLFSNKRLKRLSTPHTKANEIMQNHSSISAEDYHTLTKYLGKKGIAGSQMASFSYGNIEEGDTFLLCSDGIANISNEEILKRSIKKNGSKALDNLWKYANKSREQDNCTALILKFGSNYDRI